MSRAPHESEDLILELATRLESEDPLQIDVPTAPDTPRWHVAQGIASTLVDVEAGRFAAARSTASRTVGLARREGVADQWLGRALVASAWTLDATDHRSAIALARRVAGAFDDPWTRTLAAIVLARNAVARGDGGEALRCLEGASGLPRYSATVAGLRMRAHLAGGFVDAAHRTFEEAWEATGAGRPWAAAEVLAAAPEVLLAVAEGDFGHARTSEILDLVRGSSAPLVGSLCLALGAYERWAGRLEIAAEWYREALGRWEALAHPATTSVRGSLCLLHLLGGRLDEAARELRAFEPEAPPGVAAALGAAIAAAASDRRTWAHHHEHARAWLVNLGTADHALCFRLAREAWSAGLDRDDRSRAFRAGAAALTEWAKLGRLRERRDELRGLRALASVGVPVPAGPFDLGDLLGEGGAGTVWRGRHHVHATEVAVKVLRREVTGDETLRHAFHSEVRVVAGLEHPGIVRVLGYGELDETAAMAGEARMQGAPWFAMELVSGGTAQEVVGRLRWSACRGILIGVLDALAHAHARQVLHLDIKPANVLLEALPDQEGAFRPRLTDFGLSGLVEGGPASGTPQYMAPEQFRGRDLGPWTDLYAVGCLATALLTGRPPFVRPSVDALRQAHIGAEPPELEPVVQVPRGFESWVLRLLEKLPGDRFETAADAAWALHRLGDPANDDPPRNASVAHQHTAPISFSLPAWDDDEDDDDGGDDGSGGPRTTELPPMPVSWRPPAITPLPGIQALELFELKRIPVVSRHRERDLLWATLADVHRHRRPRLVALEGRPGTGRSRLATWLAETAAERGAAHAAWLTVGAARCDLARLATSVRWNQGVRRALEADPRLRETVAGWRDDEESDDDEDSVPDERERGRRAPVREEVLDAVMALVRAASTTRPVILLLEGIPAANHELVELTRRLLASELAVLIAFAASPGTDVTADRRYEELLDLPPTMAVTVEPLRPAEIRELLRDLLPIEPALAHRIVERSSTDVDLALAYLRDLVRRDALRQDGAVLVLRDGLDLGSGATLLRSWADRLEATLDRAPPALRDVLGTLALTHREFGVEAWKAVSDATGLAAPSRHLRELRTRRLLVSSTHRGLSFCHPTLPQYLLEEAEADGRRPGLARLALDRLTFDHPGHRGLALVDTGELAAALPFLGEGLRLARDGDPELARTLTTVSESVLRMLGANESDPRWLPVLLTRGHLAHRDLGHVDAIRLTTEALGLAEATGRNEEEFDALLQLALVELEQGETARADLLLKRALGVARQLKDPLRIARTRTRIADAALGRGDLDGALHHYGRGLEALGTLPWNDLRGELSLGLGRALAASGKSELAERTLTESLARLGELGDERRSAAVMGALGRVELLRGRSREAARWFSEALQRLPDSDRRGRAELLLDQCTVFLTEERWGAVRTNVELVLTENPTLSQDTRVWALSLQLAASAPDAGADFETTARELGELLRATVLASVEVARVLEIAARRSMGASRKRRAWTLAEAQWRSLGERAAARRAREAARNATD